MNKEALKAIFERKQERRKRLAALPLEEKVRIIEQMRELGLAMMAARGSLRPGNRSGAGEEPGNDRTEPIS